MRTLLKCPAFLSGDIWNSTSLWERLIRAWVRLKDGESSSIFRACRRFSASCRWRIGASGQESFGGLLWPVCWNRTARTCCSVAALLSLHLPHHHPWGGKEKTRPICPSCCLAVISSSPKICRLVKCEKEIKVNVVFTHQLLQTFHSSNLCQLLLFGSCHTNTRKHYVFCIIDFLSELIIVVRHYKSWFCDINLQIFMPKEH